MTSKLAITGLTLALLALPPVAQAQWDLITPEEDARDRAAPKGPGPKRPACPSCD